MLTIGYVRVSTDRQAEEGVSLEAQEAKIRAMATVQALSEIRSLRRQGHTLRGIAVTLNSRGHRTRRGTDWRLESVARVIKQQRSAAA